MTPELSNILSRFNPITLDEMDSVKLMDRADTKFLFEYALLPSVFDKLKPDYRVLDIDGRRISNYETLYFDTDDIEFYTKHQNGKLNRYKVRYRKYIETGKCFFEVKFKTNKEKTIKERIKVKELDADIGSGKTGEFLKKSLPVPAERLSTRVRVFYSRITLVNNLNTERVTLDLGLKFRTEDKNNNGLPVEKSMPDFVISEVKQGKFSAASPFVQTMKQFCIHPTGFSKYCIGSVMLFPGIKYNRFKPHLLKINKLTYGNTSA